MISSSPFWTFHSWQPYDTSVFAPNWRRKHAILQLLLFKKKMSLNERGFWDCNMVWQMKKISHLKGVGHVAYEELTAWELQKQTGSCWTGASRVSRSAWASWTCLGAEADQNTQLAKLVNVSWWCLFCLVFKVLLIQ